MEVTVQEDTGKIFKISNLQEKAAIFDLRRRIQQEKGYRLDQQILKIGQHFLSDMMNICQLPTDESFRSPEIAVNFEDKQRIIVLRMCKRKFLLNLRIQDPNNKFSEISMELYSSCTVHSLKQIVTDMTKIKISEQVISNRKDILADDKYIFHYVPLTPYLQEENKITDNNIDNFNTGIIEEELMQLNGDNQKQPGTNVVTSGNGGALPKFELSLVVKKFNPLNNRISVGLDFTFNSLRNVKRVNWQENAPWFRESQDGLNWLCYCKNSKCAAHHQLVVVPRGFSLFKLSKELRDNIVCPVCKQKDFDLRNVGFVNCEWALKGKLYNKDDSRVFAEGKTYDGKLYTFKETNYGKAFESLEIMVKRVKEAMIVNDSHVYSESSCRTGSNQSDVQKNPTLEKLQQKQLKIQGETNLQIVLDEKKKGQQFTTVQAKKFRSIQQPNQPKENNPQSNWKNFAKCNACCADDMNQNLDDQKKTQDDKNNQQSQIVENGEEQKKCVIF
ncbi:UNKNOWN [Stylonychia lemnae]|uniref:Ubiquitin-like domain-containing protein n=1 Tax=Stylonychia lemnae TaxID=5949 RepID=A0A078A9P6_STYLE|nr:UNKNOWN [Stylonychia lemnae]|eukprot:CDW78307.1 UNKNOWN [Stylonychia lemnae]